MDERDNAYSGETEFDSDVIEKLAEHVHNQWLAGRLSEGWTVGPELNSKKQEHPCIVPYHTLPDAEKDRDRATVRATIKGLQELGYRISTS